MSRIPKVAVLRLLALSLILSLGCTPAAENATVEHGAGGAVEPAAPSTIEPAAPSTIEPAELAARIERGNAPLILDCRRPDEFAAGHIPGAINIPHVELADRIAELPIGPNDEVVVHCAHGRRAAASEDILIQAGFTKVVDLSGHFSKWQELELPAEVAEEEPAEGSEP